MKGERRSSPGGTSDSSPRFQPRENGSQFFSSPVGTTEFGTFLIGRPYGTLIIFLIWYPALKCRANLGRPFGTKLIWSAAIYFFIFFFRLFFNNLRGAAKIYAKRVLFFSNYFVYLQRNVWTFSNAQCKIVYVTIAFNAFASACKWHLIK